jgi:hypothetical protein
MICLFSGMRPCRLYSISHINVMTRIIHLCLVSPVLDLLGTAAKLAVYQPFLFFFC